MQYAGSESRTGMASQPRLITVNYPSFRLRSRVRPGRAGNRVNTKQLMLLVVPVNKNNRRRNAKAACCCTHASLLQSRMHNRHNFPVKSVDPSLKFTVNSCHSRWILEICSIWSQFISFNSWMLKGSWRSLVNTTADQQQF